MNARTLLALTALAACTPRTTGNIIPFLDAGDDAATSTDAIAADTPTRQCWTSASNTTYCNPVLQSPGLSA